MSEGDHEGDSVATLKETRTAFRVASAGATEADTIGDQDGIAEGDLDGLSEGYHEGGSDGSTDGYPDVVICDGDKKQMRYAIMTVSKKVTETGCQRAILMAIRNVKETPMALRK